jgi:hypothetical protein
MWLAARLGRQPGFAGTLIGPEFRAPPSAHTALKQSAATFARSTLGPILAGAAGVRRVYIRPISHARHGQSARVLDLGLRGTGKKVTADHGISPA